VIVGHVTCGEDSFDTGVATASDGPDQVSGVVGGELSVEEVGVGRVTDGGEVSGRVEFGGVVFVEGATDSDSGNTILLVAEDFIDDRIPLHLDPLVLEDSFGHDLAGTE